MLSFEWEEIQMNPLIACARCDLQVGFLLNFLSCFLLFFQWMQFKTTWDSLIFFSFLVFFREYVSTFNIVNSQQDFCHVRSVCTVRWLKWPFICVLHSKSHVKITTGWSLFNWIAKINVIHNIFFADDLNQFFSFIFFFHRLCQCGKVENCDWKKSHLFSMKKFEFEISWRRFFVFIQ